MKLRRISPGVGEIEREGHMLVPARFYLPTKALGELAEEQALEQLRNVAHLPGIVKYGDLVEGVTVVEKVDEVTGKVTAHKVWVARLYQAYEPNTVIISNGFAAMGISVPGAIAAKLVHPDRKVVALCGDGGFLMNSQELETAKRIGANVTVVVWRDDGYGLIDWKQRNEFGRPFGVEFGNPDFVAYAESFGIAGFRPASSADLYPTLMRALDVDGPSVVEIPIDYRENLRLTEQLGAFSGTG